MTSSIGDFIFPKLQENVKKKSKLIFIAILITFLFAVVAMGFGIAAFVNNKKQQSLISLTKDQIVTINNVDYVRV